jgi:(2Fe-2S) ferredoxin
MTYVVPNSVVVINTTNGTLMIRWRTSYLVIDTDCTGSCKSNCNTITTNERLRYPVPGLPIGSIGWSLGPQNLGDLRPRCIMFLTLLLESLKQGFVYYTNPWIKAKMMRVFKILQYSEMECNCVRKITEGLFRKYRTGFKLTTLVVIDTDCTGSCKSNCNTITTNERLRYPVPGLPIGSIGW